MIQLVWFKRDLRVADHAPLATAAARGPVLPLYILEPELWAQPDRSHRQYLAAGQALAELRDSLHALGLSLCLRVGEAVPTLQALHAALGAFELHAHQETDTAWTYARDRQVAAWCRTRGIVWHQYRQHGVVRGLRERRGWAGQWEALMRAPQAQVTSARAAPAIASETWPPAAALGLAPQTSGQPSTRAATLARLEQFLQRDGIDFRRGISSPLSAETAGSRLSVGLTWGTVSLREVVQQSRARRAAIDGDDAGAKAWRQSLASFDKRLHWHCHFIQKLETEPRLETENLHRAYDGLRESAFDDSRFQAWCKGETGWPYLDACMRSLNASGWINFRMRAMLMSSASYLLWLHWRPTALHLARQFTDYEPGIHYPQAQMQSGTTGINTYRIYNPVKQGFDQDPDGVFIRRWLPELARLSGPALHEPWTASAATLRAAGVQLGRDYPTPILDPKAALWVARVKLRGLRAGGAFRAEADALQRRLGSRASGLTRTQRGGKARKSTRRSERPAQPDLFD